MDEELKQSAQAGNIDAVYALIQHDAHVFRRIDQMEFVDTPLHIAAAVGHADFAMEMMNLKPSFARKLNQCGFSPIHLAFQNGKTEMVVDLLSVDKDLARVKGRKGYTLLHYVAAERNADLLSKLLDHCPDCVSDLTIWKETALHIAAKNNNLEAFKAILQCIQRATKHNQLERTRVLNLQDKDGNTVLHMAALSNQLQMIKLLTECKEVDRDKINRTGMTALGILQPLGISQRQNQVENRESIRILTRAPSMIDKVPRLETKLTDCIKRMKPEMINALLVVLALVLQMTYQAVLSPPAGLWQAADGSNKGNPSAFYWFYLPNGIAFFMAWFTTLTIFDVMAKSILSSLFPLYLSMCFCYGFVMASVAQSTMIGVLTFGAICIVYLCIVKLIG